MKTVIHCGKKSQIEVSTDAPRVILATDPDPDKDEEVCVWLDQEEVEVLIIALQATAKAARY